MNALLVYDSTFGNTETIARAVASAMEGSVDVVEAGRAPADLSGVRLLIVGSPTQGGRPTRATTDFITRLNPRVQGLQAAAFDTRIDAGSRGLPLRTLMKVIGYAAPKLAKALQAKGIVLAAPAEGFIVLNKEGPLEAGELERAEAWGRMLAAQAPVNE
jgi:flavodoxin